MPRVRRPTTTGRKDPKPLYRLSQSPRLGRLAIVNHVESIATKLAPALKFQKLNLFLSSHLWPWIWSYLKHLGPRCPFPTYQRNGVTKNGVYQLAPVAGSKAIHFAIAGDWATGTDESWQIAELMKRWNPDFTIHLGDVYYVGGQAEIEENCLGRSVNGYTPVSWPHGTQGSFALNGNHEMYAGGRPYFTLFLKTLGMKGDPEGQVASFFSLETAHWRILAFDTGYNSTGIPILSQIPLLKEIPWIGGDCHLEPEFLDWLRDVVNPRQQRKPTVFLCHHQYFTAFPEQFYDKPAKQLAEFFPKQEILWLWAHEHRLALYDRFQTPEGLTFYGRCVGHSGMPVEMASPDPGKAPLLLYDPRHHALDAETQVGENGYLRLTLQDAQVTLAYHDIHDKQLLVERFTPNPDGTLTREVLHDSGDLERCQSMIMCYFR